MKQWLRPVVRLLGRLVAASVMCLLRLTGRRAGVALVYHGLSSRTGEPDVELVAPHGVALFDAEIRHLARTFRVVDAAQLPQAAAGRRRGERFPAAVTFDDDLTSHVSLALPILQRAGVSATFFLTGATLHGPFSFWWERLQRAAGSDHERLAEFFAALDATPPDGRHSNALQELGRLVERLDPAAREAFVNHLDDPAWDTADGGLTAEGVRTLVENGMSIGFHTRHHYFLPSLDERALPAAFDEGRAELEDLVGQRLTVVAYPHGAADERVATAARNAGFKIGYTGLAAAVQTDTSPLLLGRLAPSHRSVGDFALHLVAVLLRTRTTVSG